jgi:hypothetical protein
MAGNLGFAPPQASVFCFAAESGHDCKVYESTPQETRPSLRAPPSPLN